MKFRLLNGIVYNACDRISHVPFETQYLAKVEMPQEGEWIIDLKINSAKDNKGKKINLPFTQEFHEWFLREVNKANGNLEDIKEARLKLKFNLKNNNPIQVQCDVLTNNDKEFTYSKQFHLFTQNFPNTKSEKISKQTWDKLNKLSKKELLKLFDLANIGLLNDVEDTDKDELVLILSTEPESKILNGLKKLAKLESKEKL